MGVESRKVYAVYVKHKKPLDVMEPVKGGTLVSLPKQAQKVFDDLNTKRGTNFSNAAYALRFSATPENVCMTLSGMSDIEQMKDNIASMKDLKKNLMMKNFRLQMKSARYLIRRT